MDTNKREIDRIQRLIARAIATSPAGVNLLLIGGFRFRLLDQSQRFSADIDYHWGADLDKKQNELLDVCRRLIIGRVRRELAYEGSASLRTGPDAESPNARFLDLLFWKAGRRLEIPIELTRIFCLDPPIVRTAEGIVHVTASDADLVESKIIAVLNRVFIQHRDLVDLFIFGDNLKADSPKRMKQKLNRLRLSPSAIRARLKDLDAHQHYHAGAVQKVIAEQMETIAAQQLNVSGGGKAVLDGALELLKRNVPS